MNHHDIRLIEIGQKEGYAKAVKEIVAWLLESAPYSLAPVFANNIEARFSEQKKNAFLHQGPPGTPAAPHPGTCGQD